MVVYNPRNGKLRRAFDAHLLLILSVASFFLMDIMTMIKDFDRPSITGRISWDTGSVVILQKFHWIPFLDEVFKDVTVGFAPSTFEYDAPTWWQMFNFLNDFGVLYMIVLLEAGRRSSRGTAAYFPGVMGFIAQLGGGGVFIPLNFFLHLVFCPPVQMQSSADRRIDINRAFIWLPLMLLFHTVPVFGMYLASDFDSRHYWTWAWQLYTVRVSLGYYAILALSSVLPSSLKSLGQRISYHAALRIILGPFIAISTVVWINLLVSCPYSFSTLFSPIKNRLEIESRWVGMIRRCLQYDELVVLGSAFIWLFYLQSDLKAASMCTLSQSRAFMALLLLIPVIGPGATLGVIWLWKEKSMVEEKSDELSSSQGSKKAN